MVVNKRVEVSMDMSMEGSGIERDEVYKEKEEEPVLASLSDLLTRVK